jgi:hypothetical protein
VNTTPPRRRQSSSAAASSDVPQSHHHGRRHDRGPSWRRRTRASERGPTEIPYEFAGRVA